MIDDALEKAWQIIKLIDGASFEEIEKSIKEIAASENPNLAHIELLKNLRTYKRILNGIE